MCSVAKQVPSFLLPALLFCTMLLGACENDLNKIKEISAKYASLPVDTAKGVDIVYSDSAVIKGTMKAPLMINYTGAKASRIMPKGVRVGFFDQYSQENGNIVGDSAVYKETEKIIEFYKNVVYTSAKGDICKSDELIWDQGKKIMYSNKPVQIILKTGDVMNGINFTSDQELKYPSMNQGTGVFSVSDLPKK